MATEKPSRAAAVRSAMKIRDAGESDLPVIIEIYNDVERGIDDFGGRDLAILGWHA